jgi:wyosine [tRNA(Phe)-imidazoG37] synthetase (radical SAM superfamily)
MNILKLDSAFDLTVNIHNQPRVNIRVNELIEDLKKFNGKLIIQTLFLKGIYKGKNIDNTTPAEINAWLEALRKIKPSEVMIYTFSRDTPEGGDLKKIPVEELRQIARKVEKLGIATQVSG